ncbi:MAG: NAD-dependent epimerase/dehydratase family protein [Elusimicrobia bacterium]|nr:NAD-dependent epimerase/dehydratase family protein [Elusimicrobiota bacterium]
MKGKAVLLTGGTGFVGRHLAEALAALGARVRCLARRSSAHQPLAALGAELAFGGLDDEEALRRASAGCEVVFHCAGATKAAAERDFHRINAEGTARLVAAVERAAPRAVFVHVSSLAAAGPSQAGTPRVEDDPPEPVSSYGRSKLAAEEAVRASGLHWVIARPPAVYGPRDTDVYSFFKLASWGLFPVIGGVERSLSLVHAADLAQGLILAAGARRGSVYFLCDPRPYALAEVMETIAGTLGRKLRRFSVPFFPVAAAAWLSGRWGSLAGKPSIFNPDKAREMRQANWTCSPARAERELAFKVDYPLKKGVEQTAAWYKENGWL